MKNIGLMMVSKYLINQKNINLNDGLLFAAMYNQMNVIDYLLEKGANPDAALVGGAKRGRLNIVKYAIDKGAKDIDRALEVVGLHKGVREYLLKFK